ncbi:MAG: hypothetical protein QM759_16355 [Terricaulis sp.]
MSHRLHFQPKLDTGQLRLAAARFFSCDPAQVFVYHDAVDIFGSEQRDPDPVQKAAFEAAAARILVRRYAPDMGPIEGWLLGELQSGGEIDEGALARALAAGAGVTFYYLDPEPDPEDEPGAQAAQIEVSPDGATRKVWLSEFSDDTGTETIVSGRGEDEDAEQ